MFFINPGVHSPVLYTLFLISIGTIVTCLSFVGYERFKRWGYISYVRLFFSSLIILCAGSSAIAQNAIITENALPGNPISEWGVPNFHDVTINGFSTEIGVNKGQTVRFKIDVQGALNYSIKIYRIGYYNGNGARLMADLGLFSGIVQAPGISDAVTGLLDCGNWIESAHWDVPNNAVSGLYIARLQSQGGGSSHIAFIVKDDASNSDLFFQMPDATWQAYNGYGGNYLYNGTTNLPNGHASKVSYNRPIIPYNVGFFWGNRQSDWYMNSEYPMIRWLERNGYDISYTTAIDVARQGNLILNHKVFITNGHDEYWSKEQHDNVEAARNAGVHMAFFSGNEVYWKTRWENDINGDDHRTLICYKEGTMGDGSLGEASCGSKCDVSSSEWTGLWRTGGAYDAGLPENGLTGQIGWNEAPGAIQVTDTFKNLRFWRNTSIANLGSGQTVTLAPNTLGYEWDYEQYPDSYPHGRIALSSTTVNGLTHKLSLYRHSSGALVFGAGTIQWSWGLDDAHFGGTPVISKDMQQATVNLFADMGVQPGSIQNDLVAATQSTDHTAPVSVITSPASGTDVAINVPVTITGTASDADGAVAGVEISVDGGVTWKVATGTTNWSFTWTPTAIASYTIKSRAFDDSGNMEAAGTNGQSNVIVLLATICPCTIFTTQTPTDMNTYNDGPQPGIGVGFEVGVKFRSNINGFVKGVRFYKTAGNTGVHTGELYSSDGTRLAQAVFSSETGTGWQQVLFSTPIAIIANTTYTAAYFSSLGNYTEDNDYFVNPVNNGYLTALADGTDGGNAPFLYTNAPAFPNQFFRKANYWVDVVFTENTSLPVQLTSFTVSIHGADAELKWTTASEQNNKGFEIQRSSNGSKWEAIGFVNGKGNSQAVVNYQFLDKSPGSGKFYYRLKQIDLDGKSKMSDIASVVFSDHLSLELKQNHPNPFSATTTINFTVPKSGRIKLLLYDQMGRMVRQIMDETKSAGAYQVTMDRKGLSAGMYYYKLDASDESVIKKMNIL